MRADQMDFVRSAKGAAASILLAMVLMRRCFQAKDLELVTGYSDKPIKKGLVWLEKHGLVKFHGRQYGWALSDGLAQLELFSADQLTGGMALIGKESSTVSGVGNASTPAIDSSVGAQDVGNASTSAINNEVGEIPTNPVDNFVGTQDVGNASTSVINNEVGEIPISYELSTGSKSEKFRFGDNEVGEIPISQGSTRAGARAPESSSTSNHLTKHRGKEKKKGVIHNPRSRRNSDFLDRYAPTDDLKMVWMALVRADVGKYSLAMQRILQERPSLTFVESHVEARKALGNKYPANWMITKIEQGESPPDHRNSENDSDIPPEYAHLIQR